MVGGSDGNNDFLQDSIFRTFQETESLLQHLRVGTMDESSVPSDPSTGAKMPKDDKIIGKLYKLLEFGALVIGKAKR